MDAETYIKGRDTKTLSEHHRKTIIDCVFYELMRSNARNYMLNHLNSLRDKDDETKKTLYKEEFEKLCGKEMFEISDVTMKGTMQ